MPVVLRRPLIQCRCRDSNGLQHPPDDIKDEACCGFHLPT